MKKNLNLIARALEILLRACVTAAVWFVIGAPAYLAGYVWAVWSPLFLHGQKRFRADVQFFQDKCDRMTRESVLDRSA